MKNNKKIIALTTSILLLFVFGNFLLPVVKATETYTTTEEIEDFSCVDDTTLYSGYFIYGDAGSNPLITIGYDIGVWSLDTEFYISIFKFNLTNRPENYIKAEVVLTFDDYGYNMLVPFYISNNTWNEEELTYENQDFGVVDTITLPVSFNNYFVFSGFGGEFIDVSYNIDIIEYSESQFITFGLTLFYPYSSKLVEEDIYTIYSKEYPVESVRPKIIWTVEHEIILPQNNEPLFLIIGLSVGLIVGLVAIGVIIVLNKRKSKF